MIVNILFQPDMAEAIFSTKRKRCTSRFKKFGNPGDTFPLRDRVIGDRTFGILAVPKLPLGFVEEHLYKLEGFDSPLAFHKRWDEIHRKRNNPKLLVYVHFFEEIE